MTVAWNIAAAHEKRSRQPVVAVRVSPDPERRAELFATEHMVVAMTPEQARIIGEKLLDRAAEAEAMACVVGALDEQGVGYDDAIATARRVYAEVTP